MSDPAPTTPNAENTAAAQPPKKKRNWILRLFVFGVVLVILLAVLVGLLPMIASSGAARDYVLSVAAGSVNGQVAVDGWSLTWFGPIEVKALKIDDADDREVLSVQSLSLEKGLWQLITGGLALGEIKVSQPKVLLHYDADGGTSLAKVFAGDGSSSSISDSSNASSSSSSSSSLPDISAKLVVEDGSVTFARDGFDPYAITKLGVDVQMPNLNQIDGDLKMVLGDGKPLTGKVALTNLAPNHQIDLAQASGSATLATDGEVEIGNLVGVITGQSGTQGKAKLAVNVKAEQQSFLADADIRVINLISPQVGKDPLNLALTGSGGLKGETLDANVELAGSSAKFITIAASGTMADIQAKFSTNLAQLRREIAQAIDLGELDFSGQADGTVRLTQADGGGYATEANITVQKAAFKSGAQDLSVGALKLAQKGAFGTPGETVRSTGELELTDVKAGGESLDQQASVSWEGLVFGDGLKAKSLNVKATPLALDATGLSVDLAAAAIDGGDLKLGVNLAKLMPLVGAIAGMEKPPALAGKIHLTAKASADNGGQKLTGAGTITKLVIGEGDSAVREDKLDLALNAQIDTASNTLTLGENKISSEKLTLDLKGKINDYTGKMVADISGDYELSWPAITAMLHELSPSMKDIISVKGKSSSPLSIKGPLNDPDAKPSFRGLNAGLALKWDAIDLYGIPVSAATFEPKLADGQITLPKSTLSAVQGKVTLGAEVDFKPEDMTLRIPGATKILDGVKITPELTKELLSRINPIFYEFVDANGQINLNTQDLVLPLGESLKQAGNGSGVLELVKMKVRVKPGSLLGTLLEFSGYGKLEELFEIGLRGGDFEVKEGRIAYDDFTLIFPADFDVKFYGSVGFDDSLDLVISIPIRSKVLAALGVTGDLQKYAEMLEGTRIDVPLSGTRQQPKLDLSKVDVKKLMQGVMKNTVQEEGKKLLEGLMGGEKKDGDDSEKKSNPLGGLMDSLKKK